MENQRSNGENQVLQANREAGLAVHESLRKGLERLVQFENLNWEQLLELLYGMGWSRSTYLNTLSAVRVFFDEWSRTTNREHMPLHPAEVTHEHVEMFFDWYCERRKQQSAAVKVAQLSAFLHRLEQRFPAYMSPFADMPERLKAKLRGPKKGDQQKEYPYYEEISRIFDFLEAKNTLRDYYKYVLCRFLFVHGLRIGELVQCQWSGIEVVGDKKVVHFIGKGRIDATQQLDEEVMAEVTRLRNSKYYDGPYLFMAPPLAYYNRIKFTHKVLTPYDAANLMGELSNEVNENELLPYQVHIHPHWWRHCCGTFLHRELHWPIQDIARYLRHSSLDSSSIYMHGGVRSPMEAFPRRHAT